MASGACVQPTALAEPESKDLATFTYLWMIKGGLDSVAHGRFAAFPGRKHNLDASRTGFATQVLRLGSAYHQGKSKSSSRLAQDDGILKEGFAEVSGGTLDCSLSLGQRSGHGQIQAVGLQQNAFRCGLPLRITERDSYFQTG